MPASRATRVSRNITLRVERTLASKSSKYAFIFFMFFSSIVYMIREVRSFASLRMTVVRLSKCPADLFVCIAGADDNILLKTVAKDLHTYRQPCRILSNRD